MSMTSWAEMRTSSSIGIWLLFQPPACQLHPLPGKRGFLDAGDLVFVAGPGVDHSHALERAPGLGEADDDRHPLLAKLCEGIARLVALIGSDSAEGRPRQHGIHRLARRIDHAAGLVEGL